MATMDTTKVFFSTLFALNEAARGQLAERYAETQPHRAVLTGGTSTTQFVLQHQADDKDALRAFVELFNQSTNKVDEDAKPIEDIQILRLKGTFPSLDDDGVDWDDSESAISAADAEILNDATEVRHWKGALDAHLTKAIGSLTGCNIEQKLDDYGLLVKGGNAKDVERAVSKLDVVSSSIQRRSTFPVIHNFQISEGETNISLQIVPLRSLSDRRLVTTLVPQSLSHRLGSQLVVVMMQSGRVYPDLAVRSNDRRAFNAESLLWRDVPYASTGHIDRLLMDARTSKNEEEPPAAGKKYRTLSEWVDETSAAIPATVDPFVPLPEEQKIPNQVLSKDQSLSEPLKPNADAHVSPKKRPVKARKAKGALTMDPPAAELANNGPTDTKMLELVSDGLPKVEERTLEQVPEPDLWQISSAPTAQSPRKSQSSSNHDEENTEATDRHGSVRASSYMDDLRSLQPVDAPEIQPPYMPARSTTSGATSNTKSESSWNNARVTGVKEGRLIDVITQEQPRKQKQASNTLPNRRPRNTMNQRKAPSEIGLASSHTGVLKRYDGIAAELLSLLRSTPGQIKLEVRVGRLMIDYQSGSSEYKKRPFAVSQWPSVFPNTSGSVKLQSFITERLTSSGADADFISQLRLQSQRKMFTPEACERGTFYRFACILKGTMNLTATIDIYQDKTLRIRSKELLVGALDLHFTKRYWDARIAITMCETLGEVYRKAARYIVDNLSVVPAADRSHLDLYTKIENGAFLLQSIEAHRETRHRSTNYPDLLLKLSEVQELSFDLLPPGPSQKCHAWTKAKKDMANDGKLWWEVSLASVSAEKILQENETLELGNSTKWKPGDIIAADVVRNMSHLARDIVTRIDSVGYHNKGPKTGSSTEASEKAISKLGFW